MPLGFKTFSFETTTSSTASTVVSDAPSLSSDICHAEGQSQGPTISGIEGLKQMADDMTSDDLEAEGRPPYLHVSRDSLNIYG